MADSEASAPAKLVSGSVERHVVVQTAPMLVGLSATTSVGILDAYFVGQLGPDALAAIGFVFPVHIALLSLGVGVMVAINSVLARALGGREQDLAAERAVQGVFLSGVMGVVIAGLIFLFGRELFVLLNAEGHVLELIEVYMRPYAFGYAGMLVAMGLNGVLRGQGEAVKSSTILVSMAFINGVLDPILIAGWGPIPAFGVAGASYATSAAFLLSMCVGAVLVQKGDLPLQPRRLVQGDLRAGALALARVCGPAAFANSVNPIGLTVLMGLLATHGAAAVAAFGAASRVVNVVAVPLLAMSSSIGPVVGQNWGAGAYARARAAWRFSMGLSIAYGAVSAAVLVIFRATVGGVFSESAEVLFELDRFLLVTAWGLAGFGVLIVTNGALNAIDCATTALWVSVGRVFLVMIPAAFMGSAWAGTTGVYAAILAANLLGGVVSFFIGRRGLSAEPSRR